MLIVVVFAVIQKIVPRNICHYSEYVNSSCIRSDPENRVVIYIIYIFRAIYQSAQFINWPAQSRN